MKKKLFRLLFVFVILVSNPVGSFAQEGYLGEVKMVAFNFAPRGWADCSDQLLPITKYSALFALLGTLYGGDGRTTFALPDLRGRVPMGAGKGFGLADVKQGDKLGLQAVPAMAADEKAGSVITVHPYIGMRYVICLEGIFPSRN